MTAESRNQTAVVDTTQSPFATLRPIAVGDVRLADSIWEPRRRMTSEQTVPQQHALLESTGRLDNFRRAAGSLDGEFVGRYFNDSDVYKWIEAASWVLAANYDPDLDALLDDIIRVVGDAQLPDGYLDNFYVIGQIEKRWTDLAVTHELYCAGHLFQAGVAHRRATGKTTLLEICCRFADLICDTFGPAESGKTPGTDGHEEIELALVELGRVTGNKRYIDQALYFLDARGYGLVGGDEYHQDHIPFRDASAVVGHAVRQVYLTAGAADIFAETGDAEIRAALDRLWENMVARRIYVSGGIGSRWDGEAFGGDFELSNQRAYTESCAAIGSVMWNWRMLLITGQAKYADLMESTLYNGMLPGISVGGDLYFYQNPLSDDGAHRREPWFDCACCPPNLARTLASIGGYLATTSELGVWLHLYARGGLAFTLASGDPMRLQIDTDYPWNGRTGITVEGEGEFSLFLRLPDWSNGNFLLSVNGESRAANRNESGYLEIRRNWSNGDEVVFDLPMPVRQLRAHPYLFENTGRVAVMRGPILYCLEQADNPGIDPRDIVLGAADSFEPEHWSDLLGGATVLKSIAETRAPARSWESRLYADSKSRYEPGSSANVTLIPYFLWANREPGRMEVWLRSR